MRFKSCILCLITATTFYACTQPSTVELPAPIIQDKQLTKKLVEKFSLTGKSGAEDHQIAAFIDSIHTSLDGKTDYIFTYVYGVMYRRQILVWWKEGNDDRTLVYKTWFKELKEPFELTFTLLKNETNAITRYINFAQLNEAKNKMSIPMGPLQGIGHVQSLCYFIFDFKDSLDIFVSNTDELGANLDHAATWLAFEILSKYYNSF